MILENTFERQAVNDYRSLKEKEKACLESIEKAIEANESAWKSGDDALMQAAGTGMDQALEAHKILEKELEHVACIIADFALNSLRHGNCLEEGK